MSFNQNQLGYGFLLFVLTGGSGCAVVVGNVKPEERSNQYHVISLAERDKDWQQMPSEGQADDSDSTSGDVAYQARSTASIISLNSSCRPRLQDDKRDLRNFTNTLLLGFTDVTSRQERERSINSVPALETTIQGQLNSRPMALRTIVLRTGSCLYDIMYVSKPEHFSRHEGDFESFASSFSTR